MSDLVERLRSLAAVDNCQASLEAADEITRLRTEVEKLRAALKRAAHELELLYFFGISNGIAKEGIPPHVQARAALSGDEI